MVANEQGKSDLSRRAVIGAGTTAAVAVLQTGSALGQGVLDDGPVLELRQYKIVRGRREAFIELFEREFVDTQEQLSIRLVGQFRDMDDANRFTWLREFPGFETRARTLNAFYTGPAWLAHRAEANPMLDDNDNVLLLRPSGPAHGFGALQRLPATNRQSRPGMTVATIHYLWKEPVEAFTTYFHGAGGEALRRAGASPLASFVAERRPNDFPRLPVRQHEKVFVWFTHVDHFSAYEKAMSAFRGDAAQRRPSGVLMPDLEERPAQVLRLESTPRSRL